jgi:O-antigen/teichoic acid export membrane protein
MLFMSTTVVASALGAAYWVLAARLYPPHVVGLAAALLSAMGLASTLSTLGIQGTIVQRLPRRLSGPEWSATLAAAVVAATAAALLGACLLVMGLSVAGRRFEIIRDDHAYAALLAAGVAATTVSTVLDYAFVAERASGRMLLRTGTFSLVKVPLVVIAATTASVSALGILLSWVVAAFVGLSVSIVLLGGLGRGSRSRPQPRAIAREMRAMVPVLPAQHAITVAAALPMFVLPLLVAAELSPTDNAHFYTTWMVGSVFFIVSPAISWSLFAEGRRKSPDLRCLVRDAARLNALLLGPLVLVFLLGGRFALSIFGPEYAEHDTVLLLAILVISAIPDAITNIFVAVMRARATLRPAVSLNVAMAVEAIALAWILIPPMGIVGAGFAWLVAQVTGSVFVVLYVLARR